ncbi:MAG: UTP--glucose-1-phosphate uridylyltransferase GalU [Kangiellaceae bacterium]|nr:UTP--glucose-1-phosphate uridylyltransferase GalU [Kangiellaceae bacterium]
MITTAVIPVAGFGTRMLPASKSTPKELLPLADKPIIHFIIEECKAAGMKHIILVNHASKTGLENYFDRNFELEASLEKSNKDSLLEQVRAISPEGVTISSVRQDQALGLGHAVLMAKDVVGEQPFAVLLPDVLVEQYGNQRGDLTRMVKDYAKTASSQILVEPVATERISNYGIVAGTAKNDLLEMSDIVEKPSIEEAPSNLAVVGRYVFTASIWKHLEQTKAGAGNEIQLTDAILSLLEEESVFASTIKGSTYDCGCKQGYYQAFMQKALECEQVDQQVFEDHLLDLAAKIEAKRREQTMQKTKGKEPSIVQLFG